MHLGGVEGDHQLVLGRRLHLKVRRLLAFEECDRSSRPARCRAPSFLHATITLHYSGRVLPFMLS